MIESRSYTLVLEVRSLFVMINAVDRSMDKMTIKGSLNYRQGTKVLKKISSSLNLIVFISCFKNWKSYCILYAKVEE